MCHLCVLQASGLLSLPLYRSFLHLICPTCSFYHRSWVVLPPVVWPCPSCCAEPRDPRQTDLILSPAGRGRAENLYSYQLACLLRNHSQVLGPRFINKPFLLPLFFYVCSITYIQQVNKKILNSSVLLKSSPDDVEVRWVWWVLIGLWDLANFAYSFYSDL